MSLDKLNSIGLSLPFALPHERALEQLQGIGLGTLSCLLYFLVCY